MQRNSAWRMPTNEFAAEDYSSFSYPGRKIIGSWQPESGLIFGWIPRYWYDGLLQVSDWTIYSDGSLSLTSADLRYIKVTHRLRYSRNIGQIFRLGEAFQHWLGSRSRLHGHDRGNITPGSFMHSHLQDELVFQIARYDIKQWRIPTFSLSFWERTRFKFDVCHCTNAGRISLIITPSVFEGWSARWDSIHATKAGMHSKGETHVGHWNLPNVRHLPYYWRQRSASLIFTGFDFSLLAMECPTLGSLGLWSGGVAVEYDLDDDETRNYWGTVITDECIHMDTMMMKRNQI